MLLSPCLVSPPSFFAHSHSPFPVYFSWFKMRRRWREDAIDEREEGRCIRGWWWSWREVTKREEEKKSRKRSYGFNETKSPVSFFYEHLSLSFTSWSKISSLPQLLLLISPMILRGINYITWRKGRQITISSSISLQQMREAFFFLNSKRQQQTRGRLHTKKVCVFLSSPWFGILSLSCWWVWGLENTLRSNQEMNWERKVVKPKKREKRYREFCGRDRDEW